MANALMSDRALSRGEVLGRGKFAEFWLVRPGQKVDVFPHIVQSFRANVLSLVQYWPSTGWCKRQFEHM